MHREEDLNHERIMQVYIHISMTQLSLLTDETAKIFVSTNDIHCLS